MERYKVFALKPSAMTNDEKALHGAVDRGHDEQRHEADGGRILEGAMKAAFYILIVVLAVLNLSAATVGLIIIGGMQ